MNRGRMNMFQLHLVPLVGLYSSRSPSYIIGCRSRPAACMCRDRDALQAIYNTGTMKCSIAGKYHLPLFQDGSLHDQRPPSRLRSNSNLRHQSQLRLSIPPTHFPRHRLAKAHKAQCRTESLEPRRAELHTRCCIWGSVPELSHSLDAHCAFAEERCVECHCRGKCAAVQSRYGDLHQGVAESNMCRVSGWWG